MYIRYFELKLDLYIGIIRQHLSREVISESVWIFWWVFDLVTGAVLLFSKIQILVHWGRSYLCYCVVLNLHQWLMSFSVKNGNIGLVFQSWRWESELAQMLLGSAPHLSAKVAWTVIAVNSECFRDMPGHHRFPQCELTSVLTKTLSCEVSSF